MVVDYNINVKKALREHPEFEEIICPSVSFPLIENMKLSNTGAILIRSIPDKTEIIDG